MELTPWYTIFKCGLSSEHSEQSQLKRHQVVIKSQARREAKEMATQLVQQTPNSTRAEVSVLFTKCEQTLLVSGVLRISSVIGVAIMLLYLYYGLSTDNVFRYIMASTGVLLLLILLHGVLLIKASFTKPSVNLRWIRLVLICAIIECIIVCLVTLSTLKLLLLSITMPTAFAASVYIIMDVFQIKCVLAVKRHFMSASQQQVIHCHTFQPASGSRDNANTPLLNDEDHLDINSEHVA